MNKKIKQDYIKRLAPIILIIIVYGIFNIFYGGADNDNTINQTIYNTSNIPPYSGNSVIELNAGKPEFEEEYFSVKSFEEYSELDQLGRCGVAFANICVEIMPKEERGEITYKPTGWIQNKKGEYDQLVPGGYLYNRCHLIAWQLAGENNNKQNLITGTKQLNQAMITYENKVAKYVKDNEGYHVLYRTTPIFEENNLLASGVKLEAISVEEREKAQEVCFNVYIYNVQPGIYIDYKTGANYKMQMLPSGR